MPETFKRAKIPFWAMAALSLMPVWGLLYVRALTGEPDVAEGPIGIGAEVYAGCASCHGPAGEGVAGLGYPFTDGAVIETFPRIEDQIRFVYYGTDNYELAGVDIYGNPDREGGAHIAGERGTMPQQGSTVGGALTDSEILAVVCHERFTLSAKDPEINDTNGNEFDDWCSDESSIYAALTNGSFTLTSNLPPPIIGGEGVPITINPIGDSPSPGLPPEARAD